MGRKECLYLTPRMRIRGCYVKSDALFAAYQPARWLVLRGVISHPASHYPLPRNLPHGNHYPSHPGATGGGRCRPSRGRRGSARRLDPACSLRSGRTRPGRPAQQAGKGLSQARYPGALSAADRGESLRSGCCRLHRRPETVAGRLNIKALCAPVLSTLRATI